MELKKGGRGLGAWQLRKKNFFEAQEKKIPKNVDTKLEGWLGGIKALVAWPLKKDLAGSLRETEISRDRILNMENFQQKFSIYI